MSVPDTSTARITTPDRSAPTNRAPRRSASTNSAPCSSSDRVKVAMTSPCRAPSARPRMHTLRRLTCGLSLHLWTGGCLQWQACHVTAGGDSRKRCGVLAPRPARTSPDTDGPLRTSASGEHQSSSVSSVPPSGAMPAGTVEASADDAASADLTRGARVAEPRLLRGTTRLWRSDWLRRGVAAHRARGLSLWHGLP